MTREFRLGLFIVATLGILTAAVFIIGSQELLFQSTYRLKSTFDNVSGLTDGADVRVGGIHKGTIKQINLPNRPDGPVTVVMDLEGSTRSVVKRDSVAAIKSEGLLGDKYVEVSFGSKDAEQIKDGDTIPSQPPLEISDLIKKTDQLLDTTKGAVDNVVGVTSSLKSVSAKVDEGKGSIGALINDKKIYQEASAGATAFDENMEALKHNFLLRGFFKKRGYEDSDELKKYQIARLPLGSSMRTFVYDAGQIFDKPDTAKLKTHKALNEAGRYLQENKFGLAVVAVSAGLTGDSEKDRTLTEARSFVVRDYLANSFRFDDSRLKTIGLGKAVEPGEDDKVEIIVYPAPVAINSKTVGHAAPRP